ILASLINPTHNDSSMPPAPPLPLADAEHLPDHATSNQSIVSRSKPVVPDYELLRVIGRGAYGEVWLARSILAGYRAVKVVWRPELGREDRAFEREFEGIQRFEPVSRSHPSQLAILHVGKNDEAGYFYYVMELGDPLENPKPEIQNPREV